MCSNMVLSGHRISKSITLSRAIEAEEKKFDKATKRECKREDKYKKNSKPNNGQT